MYLLVGLGNPGPEYADTKHNVGFMVLDNLAARWRIPSWERRFRGDYCEKQLRGEPVAMLKPATFMNLSGTAVVSAVTGLKIEPKNLVVLHDDVDIPLGRIKLRMGGGDGGHRGIRSIIEHVQVQTFIRVRIGVGRPQWSQETADWVLQPFDDADVETIRATINGAAEAVDLMIRRGLSASMNVYNSKNYAPDDFKPESKDETPEDR